jgi:hypothetical protein
MTWIDWLIIACGVLVVMAFFFVLGAGYAGSHARKAIDDDFDPWLP